MGNKERNLILKGYTIFCIVLLGGLFLTVISILINTAGDPAQVGIGTFVPGCCITGIGFLGVCGTRIADYISLRTKRIVEARSGDEHEKQYSKTRSRVGLRYSQAKASRKIEVNSLPFRIIREIGHGGYATVYEGKYTKKGSKQEIDVAIKQLHRVYVESSGLESIKDEFEKEAAFLQQYKHPNLVEIINFIPDPHWCIVLKYYHRGSLANVLRDQKYRLPWNPERNGFMTGIAQGLKFLHANNIIHRDMKPDNVLIDEDMRPKITDFGTARIQDTLTQTKGVGTPIYIAPEVVRPITGDGKVHYDSAVDVYAFSLILWAIWKREEPFQEFENVWQMMTCVINKQGRPPLEGCPSPSLASLMSKCWVHRPDARPRMPQVCDELNTVTAELAFA